MTLTVGSLFSGIGGLDLGLERAGMRVIWQSEIDPYASRVLKKHWKDVPNHGDIKKINWQEIQRPDVLCGGYPCQPFSTAGKRRGEEDPRHLFPWVLKAISELRPRYAIMENVRGHLSMGGLSVVGQLASIGYDAEWRLVSASSVGANHRRDRLILVSYPNGVGSHREEVHSSETGFSSFPEPSSNGAMVPDSSVHGVRGTRSVYERERDGLNYTGGEWWRTEPDVGRVAHGVPSRVDRIRGLGNAVVPHVAEVVGRLVLSHYEESLHP